MCGFAGVIQKYPNELNIEEVARRMGAAIQYRGPDDAGTWSEKSQGIALAHQRLAILDLSESGHQPMMSNSGRYIIAFNGEIYNHQELRALLNANGQAPKWKGNSDTETLLASIEAWGLKQALIKSAGMFALALWDKKTKSLSLIRDRFGEKPLYYGLSGSGTSQALVFGSELAALKAFPGFNNQINRQALSQLLRFSAISSPLSIYERINQLMPGHIISIRGPIRDKLPETEPWWSFCSNIIDNEYADKNNKNTPSLFSSDEEGLNALEDALTLSIERQSIADVPLGAFLSGGIDSSLITALMQKNSINPINTFTIGFEEINYNEAPYAAAVAKHLGTAHHETIFTASDAQNLIPKLPSLYCEPFADSSQLPTHMVCKEARKGGLKVVLSGDGGDELFGGYNRYFWGPRLWEKVSWLPYSMRVLLGKSISSLPPYFWDYMGQPLSINQFGHKIHKFSNRLKYIQNNKQLYRSLISQWNSPTELMRGNQFGEEIIEPISPIDMDLTKYDFQDSASQMMVYDTINYLPNDILTKLDRAAMATGLETRAPFLDHDVAQLSWKLPMDMKIRYEKMSPKGGISKWALRQILYKYVPSELIDRPKAGFGIPIGEWLKGPLREWAEDLLNSTSINNQGFLRSDPIQKLWAEHLSNKFDHTHRLWTLLMWQAWLAKWE